MTELIPRQVLFGNPERFSPRLSPDGSQLAWIAPHEDVLNVWVAPMTRAEGVDWTAARVVTQDSDRGIRSFDWAHDDRHLLYVQDSGGDENWRLYGVDLDTMQRRDLTPFDGVQARIIAADRKFPTQVLVGLNHRDPQLHDVYRLDLVSGELTLEVPNPGLIGWLADAQLVVRAAIQPQPDAGYVLLVRDGAEADWRPLLTVDGDDASGTQLVTFSEDGRSLLITTSVGADTARLVRIDVATGARQVLAEDPDADVGSVRVHPDTRQPEIAILVKDRAEYIVLDDAVAADLAAIRALHPGDPVLNGADDANDTWLVGFTNDTGPMPYYAFDRATKTGRFLFEHLSLIHI